MDDLRLNHRGLKTSLVAFGIAVPAGLLRDCCAQPTLVDWALGACFVVFLAGIIIGQRDFVRALRERRRSLNPPPASYRPPPDRPSR